MTRSSATEYLLGQLELTRAIVGARLGDPAVGATAEVIAQLREHEARYVDLPALMLGRRLELSELEMRVVWFLVGWELASELRADVSRLIGATAPTLEVIRRAIYGERATAEAVRDLAAHRPLRRLMIIERADGDRAIHDSQMTWAVAPRVLALLLGDDSLDPAIAGIVRLSDQSPALKSLALAPSIVDQARDAMKAGRATIVAAGALGLGRRTLLAAAAREAGLATLEIDGKRLAKQPDQLARQLRAIARELKLRAAVPLLRAIDVLDSPQVERVECELAAEVDGLMLATSGPRPPAVRWDRPQIELALAAPTSEQRARLWRDALPGASDGDSDLLASLHPLAPALIARTGVAAAARARGRALTPGDIAAGMRSVLDDRLGGYARRIATTQTWNDIVLGDDQRRSLVELLARVRRKRTVHERWGFAAKLGKGLGVSALFSGPPGTGKTMVCALIARDLGLELYQVDSAKISSKWIGETEQHLGELFDAAEAGNAILLFDEADSLFGKRTEVKTSTDRYANSETNYLLQRLESFSGICLLTTNHESSLDPAFQRRLSLHVRFDVPDEHEREALWRAMLPAEAPIGAAIDFTDLGRRFAMTGGYIRNAAVRAAFLAAEQELPITTAGLASAATLELEALGKIAFA